MGDVTTRKFVGDASLNNRPNSFIHCVIFWLLQISIMGQICSFLWTRKNKKAFSFRGLCPLTLAPHRGLCPWTPLLAPPQTPLIGSRSVIAMEFELCAVLNSSLKKPCKESITGPLKSKMAEIRHVGSWVLTPKCKLYAIFSKTKQFYIDDLAYLAVLPGLFKEPIIGPLKSKMAEIRYFGDWCSMTCQLRWCGRNRNQM